MQKFGWLCSVLLFAAACTHAPTQRRSETQTESTTTTETTTDTEQASTRFAQALVMPIAEKPVQGKMSFEQMPNSTIATYRLDGLDTKKFYQISVLAGASCEDLGAHGGKSAGVPVHTFKVINKGYSESSFRTDKFSVSGKDSLIGQTVAVALLGNKKENPVQAIVGCAPIASATATEIHPVEAGTTEAQE